MGSVVGAGASEDAGVCADEPAFLLPPLTEDAPPLLPPNELPELLPDIARGHSYVLTDGGVIVGTFSFIIGDEPTYRVLLNGHWHADRPYGTIHRLASSGTVRGVSRACFDFCLGIMDYVRIDTHENNHTMQSAITGYGFRKCGNIYASNGTLRTAYDFIRP